LITSLGQPTPNIDEEDAEARARFRRSHSSWEYLCPTRQTDFLLHPCPDLGEFDLLSLVFLPLRCAKCGNLIFRNVALAWREWWSTKICPRVELHRQALIHWCSSVLQAIPIRRHGTMFCECGFYCHRKKGVHFPFVYPRHFLLAPKWDDQLAKSGPLTTFTATFIWCL
jgi:hypothetical protein